MASSAGWVPRYPAGPEPHGSRHRQRRKVSTCAVLTLLAVAGAGTASATLTADEIPDREGVFASADDQATVADSALGAKREFILLPPDDLYPAHIADLHRPAFGLVRMSAGGRGIADSGAGRFNLKLGARFGLLRVHPSGRPDRGLQVALVAGLDGMFDVDRSYDSIGWDGNYGLAVTGAVDERWAWMAGLVHTSSHVGDEYAERTGRRRLGYTREEVTGGVSWRFRRQWRTYAEIGWGYDLRNELLQEPGRAQLGLEYERSDCLWQKRLGWYAAGDASATEERGWRLDAALQVGLTTVSGGRLWRLGIELYDGRPPLGEFFQDDETYVGLGLWMDF